MYTICAIINCVSAQDKEYNIVADHDSNHGKIFTQYLSYNGYNGYNNC